MSRNLVYNLNKLQVVAEVKAVKIRKAVLAEFAKDEKFCKAVREIMKNLKRLPLTERQKDSVSKYGRIILGIVKRGTSKRQMQKLVVQTGDGFLLPMLIPLVAEAVSALIKSRNG